MVKLTSLDDTKRTTPLKQPSRQRNLHCTTILPQRSSLCPRKTCLDSHHQRNEAWRMKSFLKSELRLANLRPSLQMGKTASGNRTTKDGENRETTIIIIIITLLEEDFSDCRDLQRKISIYTLDATSADLWTSHPLQYGIRWRQHHL